jgi:SAM-dependent methyltransferase
VLDFIGEAPREAKAAEVEAFYIRHPFPGYQDADDAGRLIDRSRTAPFLAELDAAIPAKARVLDCGCGTGQLAAFLALAGPRRDVFAVDGCVASLAEADRFKRRERIDNLTLARGDLFALPFKEGAFDVVICRGVVHHTPDPDRATLNVAKLVAPGGVLLLGIYESIARVPHRFRRGLSKVLGRPIALLDPVLRRRDFDAFKKEIWIADQYLHPLERILPFPRMLELLERQGFDWLRSVPPATSSGTLFEATQRPTPPRMFFRRLDWALRCLSDEDAGLVCLLVRKPASNDQVRAS